MLAGVDGVVFPLSLSPLLILVFKEHAYSLCKEILKEGSDV